MGSDSHEDDEEKTSGFREQMHVLAGWGGGVGKQVPHQSNTKTRSASVLHGRRHTKETSTCMQHKKAALPTRRSIYLQRPLPVCVKRSRG